MADEEEVIRYKDLCDVTLPDIPGNAAAFRGFKNQVITQVAAPDRARHNVLAKWILQAVRVGECLEEVMLRLQDCHGCLRLDRHHGKILLAKAFAPSWSTQFHGFSEVVDQYGSSASGRVMLAMIARRSKINRRRGIALSQASLVNIPLAGFKFHEVLQFTKRVEYVLSGLRRSELPSHETMFGRLFQKFKAWRPIERHVEGIKASHLGTRLRQWRFLRRKVKSTRSDHFEDANAASVDHGLSQLGGARPKAAGAAAPVDGNVPRAAAPPQKKPEKKPTLRKPPPKKAGTGNPPKVKASDMTAAQKAKTPCIFHAQSRCN